MNPIVYVALFAVGLALTTQLVNKVMINEKMVDKKKEEMKELQKKMKDVKPGSKEFNEVQERVLDINMIMMKQQFKPLIVTFIPYIIAFQMMAGMFAYMPIQMESIVEVTMTGTGTVYADCLGINTTVAKKEVVQAVVSDAHCNFLLNDKSYNNSLLGKTETIEMQATGIKMQINPPKQIFIRLPFKLPFIGSEIGWLGTFVMFSFATSMITTRALKGVYLRKWSD